MPINRIYSLTYHQLYIRHRMVQPSTNNTHQLSTGVNRCRPWPLVITLVPFLRTVFHLCHIIGSQGQTLKTVMSSHGPRGDEVVQGQPVEGLLRATRALCSLVNLFSHWIGPTRIVASNPHVLDVVGSFEPLEALRLGIVNVLGKGHKSRRRRRSVGSRLSSI